MRWLTRLLGGKDEFPNDPNGDVFRRMRDHGDDLSKPREIDFNHIFRGEEKARRFDEAVRLAGHPKVNCEYSEVLNTWDVRVQIFMIPTHAGVTEHEKKLDGLARTFGGRADGWGCLQVDRE